MNARITVLCENTVGARVGTGEHGFSSFIEMEGGNYLFDTGNGSSIIRNGLLWGKDLSTVRKIFLSHGHYDHVGGCRAIIDRLGVQSTSPGVEAGEVQMLGTVCRSISTPGHTAVHKCYHFPKLGVLFAGVYSAALTALIERLSFLTSFVFQFF